MRAHTCCARRYYNCIYKYVHRYAAGVCHKLQYCNCINKHSAEETGIPYLYSETSNARARASDRPGCKSVSGAGPAAPSSARSYDIITTATIIKIIIFVRRPRTVVGTRCVAHEFRILAKTRLWNVRFRMDGSGTLQ